MCNLIVRKALFFTTLFQALLWSTPTLAVTISEELNLLHKEKIERSLDFFFNHEHREFNNEIKFLLENELPQEWLTHRLKYIVPLRNRRNWEYTLSEDSYKYPSIDHSRPNIEEEIPVEEPHSDNHSLALMSNVGANLYEIGKKSSKILTLDTRRYFSDIDSLEITSPRIGLIAISERYFSEDFYISDSGDQVADKISLLSFLFHEARHSDGNGKYLGFPHSICPPSSDYAGLKVCDEAYNGAYGISAQILKEYSSTCDSCSETEKEVLKLMYFDFEQRIINDNAMTLERKEEINDLQNKLDLFYEQLYYLKQEGNSQSLQGTLLRNLVFNHEERLKILQNTKRINRTYWSATPERLVFPSL